MAATNHQRVGKALELLREGLKPFVEREMAGALGARWLEQAAQALRRDANWREDDPHLDAHALLVIMWENWNLVFRQTLGHNERNLVSELRDVRNRWAHQHPFTTDDTYRALDSVGRLLLAIAAPEAQALEQQKYEVLRLRFAEQARNERRKATVAPVEGQPAAGLRPWREVVTPHPDVASGQYQQAEFAADLNAVHTHDATTSAEYRDPRQFFQRTYLTEGLRTLLHGALRRLSGQGSDPVIELQTNFGGGKTHSMLALYHLFSGTPAAELAGVETVLEEAGVGRVPTVRRAVLVGTALGPATVHTHPDGTTTRTMWGEMAWQLGGEQGYALLADADQAGVSPGSNTLRALFERVGPCLILIDEWLAFVRLLYNKYDLPAGSFDANLTFAQSLTEAVKQVPHALLVASLPASDIEVGGEAGQEALRRLKNTFQRVESSWRPASAEESFEIVRRRLFQPLTTAAAFTARDAVVAAFARLYREQPSEFPSATRETDYERRMQAAYPIHPELFDRLYDDWSTLEKFQRTRGVLRLMAAVIHSLWDREDKGLLILPASVPIDASTVQNELRMYLEDNWTPIIEKDVDGPTSLPLALDRTNTNLGRYSATRRVARTLYLGSAPTAKTRNPGLDERNIKLGCTQPGETVATFGDALRRLTDQATHLYVDRSRYWFSTQPSVNRLAQDRAAQLDEADVWEELKRRLRADRTRGDFAAVHPPDAEAEDRDEVRLVLLGPDHPHALRDTSSPASQQARHMLAERSGGPRLNKNMLAFLAPDGTRRGELGEALRQFLAWKSIHDERETLNLDTFQRNQAQTKHQQADETVTARIKETYIWLLAPNQSDPRDPASLTLDEWRLQGPEALAIRASRQLRQQEALILTFSASRLRMELDRFGLWQSQPHLSVKRLWEYFTRYPYLARLRDPSVLAAAIQEGFSQATWADSFAYAQGYDEATGRYLNLKAGQMGGVTFDDYSLLVHPTAAQRQLDAEAAARVKPDLTPPGPTPPGPTLPDPTLPDPAPTGPRRFYGSVTLDPLRVGRDAGQIAEEIIQHLSSLVGARVTITLDIEATFPSDVPDPIRRTVSENARTLRFHSAEFENDGG